jgi:hypothetical protein
VPSVSTAQLLEHAHELGTVGARSGRVLGHQEITAGTGESVELHVNRRVVSQRSFLRSRPLLLRATAAGRGTV